MYTLVIVESPAKASTIKNYLGSSYKVVASKGHICDLPKSSLGVDVEHDFAPHYIHINGKGDVIKQLKKDAKGASRIYLATDPDREGEAISWHLATALGIPPETPCRVTFNEITKPAVKAAIKAPRPINRDLVNSQQTRRILDRIVGYKISPFLWKNIKSGLSAGRVQSVATRIVVEREEEIRAFVPTEYWTIDATLSSEDGAVLTASWCGDGQGRRRIASEAEAQAVREAVTGRPFTVTMYKQTQKSRQPSPPFTTSTLQQEASKKLGFQSQRIMKVAQELYEGVNLGPAFGGVQGLITYMRTDSLRVADAARGAARSLITERYGEGYVPRTPRVWRAGKGAQDAHEAIRPSDVTILPQAVRSALTPDQYRLYRLIWERFVASQMSSAVYDTVTCECVCEGHVFRASAYNVRFSGFLSAFEHPEEDPPAVDGVRVSHFASFAEGEQMRLSDLSAARHFTEPPPRYNDASLIKMLEESGIGRPSTYTSILSTIVSARSYVKREGKSLVPTRLGEVTTALMKEHFPDVVDVRFTADMETKLDVIEHGDLTPTKVLGDFYTMFEKELKAAETEADSAKIELPPEESEYECEKCGAKMVYKAGRYGRFLACPNYPTCRNTKAVDKNGVPVNREESRPEPAGFTCELCGADMLIRRGRYGQFYACSNYPTCRNTKQKINDTGVTCPLCGGKIVTKYSRSHRLFYSCENYPACTFSSWDEPLAENCPVCGDRLLYKKSKKLVYCRSDSCDYTREEEPKAD